MHFIAILVAVADVSPLEFGLKRVANTLGHDMPVAVEKVAHANVKAIDQVLAAVISADPIKGRVDRAIAADIGVRIIARIGHRHSPNHRNTAASKVEAIVGRSSCPAVPTNPTTGR